MKLPPNRIYKYVQYDDSNFRFADAEHPNVPDHCDMAPEGAYVNAAGTISVGEEMWKLVFPYAGTLLDKPVLKEHVVALAEFLEMKCGDNFGGGGQIT